MEAGLGKMKSETCHTLQMNCHTPRMASSRIQGASVVAQPTWGVDVGAAAQIHGEILKLKQEGCAVLVISEELDELIALCYRLHVIAKGRLSPFIPIEQATREQVGVWMSGLWDEPAAAAAEVNHG